MHSDCVRERRGIGWLKHLGDKNLSNYQKNFSMQLIKKVLFILMTVYKFKKNDGSISIALIMKIYDWNKT